MASTPSSAKVIVVGAGIGGVTAAYQLTKRGFDVTVYDKADFVGGRMKSVTVGEFNIDVGAGILPGAYADTKALIHEAGLQHLMEEVNGNCVFLRGDRHHALDMANMAGGMITTGLISLWSKFALLRLALDLLLNYRKLNFYNMGVAAASDTDSVASYCQRNFPPEVNAYLLGPFVRTMYLHTPEEASITELLWCMKNLTGRSFSLKGGMDILAKKLAETLDVQLNTEVNTVRHCDGKVEVEVVRDGRTRIEHADYCVIASDAPGLNRLYCSGLSGRQSSYLQNLKYCPDIVITFCLRVEPAIDAILIQVPESVDPELAAVVVDNKKGAGRAPPGKGMVTCHFLSSWGARMFNESDEVILAEATARVARIVPEVATQLETYHIERWSAAATNAERGTFSKLADFMADIDAQSPVQICGDYMALSSVNVSVATAGVAVDNIINQSTRV
jgi:protoporphyrinogen/coproporphyrinogen III oxidase